MKSPSGSSGAKWPPPRPPPPDPEVMKSRQQRHGAGGKSKISLTKSSTADGSKLEDSAHHHHTHQHHHHHHHQQQQQQQQQVGTRSPGSQSDHSKLIPTRPAPSPPTRLPPPLPILTPGGSHQYQSPIPVAEFGPSGMAKVLGPTAAAAASTPSHLHSTSSSSYRGEPLTRSVPTLGTITASPQEAPPHVSPFPLAQQQQPSSSSQQIQQQQAPSTATTATLTSSAPATSAASSATAALTPTKGATPTSSINTGTTPLTTTPGGTSQPIKLTMSGLAAAVAGGRGNGCGASGSAQAMATGDGASRPESTQQTKIPDMRRSQAAIVVADGAMQAAVESPGDPQAGAMIKAPILGLNQQQQREQLTSKAPASAGPMAVPTKSNFCNCAIYIFLGIFLIIIVALIIVLVLNRKK